MTDDPRYPPSILAIQTGIQPHDGSAGLWSDKAADNGTEYVRADLGRARVAAAYEAAAAALWDDAEPEPEEPFDEWGDMVADNGERHAEKVLCRALWERANAIRSLTPADARAALDRLLAEARAAGAAQEREACAEKADVLADACEVLAQAAAKAGDKDDARWHGEAMRTAQDIARAIRARGEAATTQEGGE